MYWQPIRPQTFYLFYSFEKTAAATTWSTSKLPSTLCNDWQLAPLLYVCSWQPVPSFCWSKRDVWRIRSSSMCSIMIPHGFLMSCSRTNRGISLSSMGAIWAAPSLSMWPTRLPDVFTTKIAFKLYGYVKHSHGDETFILLTIYTT